MTRSRTLLTLGIGLLLGGIVVGGYLGWQVWGTDVVSQRRQAAINHELQKSWRGGKPIVGLPEGEAASLVRIPRFGKDYAVPVLEGTSDQVLAAGFGHFRGTAQPGEIGNFVIAAHRVTHGEPLRRMPELRPGDRILVDTEHVRYTYRMISPGAGLRVSFTEDWVLGAIPHNPDPGEVQPPQRATRLLTLTTCAELFHTNDRLIAFGELVRTAPLHHT